MFSKRVVGFREGFVNGCYTFSRGLIDREVVYWVIWEAYLAQAIG